MEEGCAVRTSTLLFLFSLEALSTDFVYQSDLTDRYKPPPHAEHEAFFRHAKSTITRANARRNEMRINLAIALTDPGQCIMMPDPKPLEHHLLICSGETFSLTVGDQTLVPSQSQDAAILRHDAEAIAPPLAASNDPPTTSTLSLPISAMTPPRPSSSIPLSLAPPTSASPQPTTSIHPESSTPATMDATANQHPALADEAATSTADEGLNPASSPNSRSKQMAQLPARRPMAHRKGDRTKCKVGVTRPKRVLLETKIVNDVETRDLKNPPSDTDIVSRYPRRTHFLLSSASFLIALCAPGLPM